MEQFIYVFSEEDRDKLLERYYALLKSDDERKVYVFMNRPEMLFTLESISFILSDELNL